MTPGEGQGWEPTEIADTLNIYDYSESRTPILIVEVTDDELHDIRCKGEWQRLDLLHTDGGHESTITDYTALVIGEEMSKKAVVRRLTPKECERLQGYPDNYTNIGDWTDSKGKKRQTTDSARYKALGNSIALPFWEWLAERMVDTLKADGVEEPTMASLFDGIGGFPLVYSRHGCKPVWASEIEEFPIAVTKRHFPEEEKINNERQDTFDGGKKGSGAAL